MLKKILKAIVDFFLLPKRVNELAKKINKIPEGYEYVIIKKEKI